MPTPPRPRHLPVRGLLALLLCAPCCGPQGRGVDVNGPKLNGTVLEREAGVSPAAQVALAVVDLGAGVELGGQTLPGVVLQGTQLSGGAQAGFAFSGALLRGLATDGSPVRIRVDGITQAPDPSPATADNENEDVYLYTLSYERGGGWAPLCAEGNLALPVAGRWDYHHGSPGDGRKLSSAPAEITFACRDSAIAKCAERQGYKPWKVVGGAPLDRLHQACVRAVRADYCGTGDSLTRQGEKINFYDVLGVQKDTAAWSFEAEWTPDGARCVDGTRLTRAPAAPRTTVAEYIERTCKAVARPGGRSCQSSRDGKDVLLYTEYAPRP